MPEATAPDHSAGAPPAMSAETAVVPLDWPSLVHRCMGSTTFAQDIVGKFQRRLAEDLPQLEAHVTSRQPERIAFVAHRLKGAAATVSAEAVRALAARMEEAARAGDLENAARSIASLHSELGRLTAYTAAGVPGDCTAKK